MSKIVDAIERAVFGATAQERVDMTIELATRRIQQKLVAALERDEAEEEAEAARSGNDATQ